jgi:outer membrane lipoprotein-sorting protein
VVPFAARRVFDLASDGHQFRLLVPDGKMMHFIVGPVGAPATSTNPRENIRPQMILEAIRWLSAKRNTQAGAAPEMRDGIESVDVILTTSTNSPLPAQLDFDLRSGTLARLIIPDPGGKQASEVDYSDWQKVQAAGAGDESVCFPRRMYVTQPQQSRILEMKFLSVEVNATIAPAQFQLVPPPGIAITRVGANANGATVGAKP